MPGRSRGVLNISRGARVGVRLGVVVRVDVALGLGETVHVGDWVRVAVWLAILVSLGTIVQVGVVSGEACTLHAANIPALNRKQSNMNLDLLRRDAEKRVVIIDLPVVNAKRIFAIAHIALGRLRCPGEMSRTACPGITSQRELAVR
jgi:hypothetical protein